MKQKLISICEQKYNSFHNFNCNHRVGIKKQDKSNFSIFWACPSLRSGRRAAGYAIASVLRCA
ncbi:MAG: hypothetical protein RML94_02860, partial [Bacteroidia bacterium]|nr:hypothetical protein [Bacteroidia bacterium]